MMGEVHRCDHCGGLAWWNLVEGEVYYICQGRCEGFEADPGVDMDAPSLYLDSVVSVSASEREREALRVREEKRERSSSSSLFVPGGS